MIHIFGEAHHDPSDIDRINKEIIRISPTVLLHELLYEDRCDSVEQIDSRLNNCKEGGVCDPRINKDIYLIGKRLRCKLIGIDLDFVDRGLTDREKFRIRESHMLTMIKRAITEFEGRVIAVVLGDTHLRSIHTKELGPASQINTELSKRRDVVIHRSISKMKEIR